MAGAEHRNALVVNLSSISGKSGQAWLSVYSATKAAVVGWTEDIAASVRFLLDLSPACVVPEIVFQRSGEAI